VFGMETGELGVGGPKRKTFDSFIKCINVEKTEKVYSVCKMGHITTNKKSPIRENF